MNSINIVFLFCITQAICLEFFIGYKHYSCGGAAWQRFQKQISVLKQTSMVNCLYACQNTFRCYSVNYNGDLLLCELTNYFPLDNTTVFSSDAGWKVYYSTFYDKNLKTGAVAWQSSTLLGNVASRALDGNNNGNLGAGSCSHTWSGGSFWAMQFPVIGPVGRIVIYFRTDCCNERNVNFHLLVSKTVADSNKNVGTLCGIYVGPPANSSVPATILCESFAYGQVLKIIHGNQDYLNLCEVYVYTH